MSVTYANPPLIEAICDFRFVQGQQPWTWTVPGLMYARIKEEFPLVQDQPALQMQVPMPAEQPATAQIMGGVSQVQFIRADETAVVQLGPSALVINLLRPYTGWEQFRALILKQFDTYTDIAAPLGLVQIQMRYINKLEIPQPRAGEALNVNQYCNVLPNIPDALNSWISGFLQRIEIEVPGSQSRLVVQSGSIPPEQENHVGILVDLEYTVRTREPLALTSVERTLEEAHVEIKKAFNECFTPAAKELFGGEVDARI
jgi:uncharacterized protein (TIGR04255 family)